MTEPTSPFIVSSIISISQIKVHNNTLSGRGVATQEDIAKDDVLTIKSGHIGIVDQLEQINAEVGDYFSSYLLIKTKVARVAGVQRLAFIFRLDCHGVGHMMAVIKSCSGIETLAER